MDKFNKILKNIKEVKIQGATAIAKVAAEALMIKNQPQRLISLRPTEPMLKNIVKLVSKDPKKNLPKVLKHIEDSRNKIIKYGANKIKNNSIVFTHCHSSTVTAILKEATKKKKFEVYNTETRPLFQGRLTAKELTQAGIKVTYFIDSGARIALKKSDLFLIGADSINTNGEVINKIGSEMFAMIAGQYQVPVFVCTDSWKIDPDTLFGIDTKIEKRSSKEVWPNAPKKVKIVNLAFEKVNSNLITGIISELGILSPDNFVTEVKKNYPWIFSSGKRG